MRSPRGRLAVAAVTLLLGFLLVVQLRAQESVPSLAGLTSQDLTILIANLSTRNEQLRVEVAGLESELRRLNDARARGEGSLDQMRTDLRRVQAWSGLSPATGPGVVVTVRGPIDGQGAQDLLNELWNAGAEAVAVEGVRFVPGVVVAGPPGEMHIGSQAVGPTFEIEAIGNPETLAGSLTRIGGIIAQVAATQPEVGVEVSPAERLLLDETDRQLRPEHGQPRL